MQPDLARRALTGRNQIGSAVAESLALVPRGLGVALPSELVRVHVASHSSLVAANT